MIDLRKFQPSQTQLGVMAFVVAALVSAMVAYIAALVIENRSASVVRSRLLSEGITWAAVSADGLQVHLAGTAPNEALRYRVVNLVGTEVDSSRVRDHLEVTPAKTVEPPRFSVEMLRNDDGVQLIGLLPQGAAKEALTADAQLLTPDIPVSDMLGTSAYPAPEGWDAALQFGEFALKLLPRSKISVAADKVAITAIASSETEKRLFESQLNMAKPDGLAVTMDVSAPRPVLTPFTLRFVMDAKGARFDACSADTEKARARIVAAGVAAGMDALTIDCTIGLGVPTPSWGAAAEAGIAAVTALGSATITFSDADVTLVADPTVPQDTYDRVVGELQTNLPGVFSLNATLTKAVAGAAQGPAEFTATLAPETHRVELRGRLADEQQRAAVDSFARAEFGSTRVYIATRLDAELPDGWPVRVLAGLKALAQLDNGSLRVRADSVEIKGVAGSQQARDRISQILSDKLGQGKTFKVDVVYDRQLDPLAALPTPKECISRVNAVLARQKITFTPGSAEVDAASSQVMADIAGALKGCKAVPIEIGGYTDAQGSEEGNRTLSQARAEAVLLALQGRQVDVTAMRAKGYGEADPIGDNTTETGREANRRIEFVLIGATAAPATDAGAGAAGAGDGVAAALGAPDQGQAQVQGQVQGQAQVQGQDQSGAPSQTSGQGPDFSGDTSPSVAPKEMTVRPKARPAKG